MPNWCSNIVKISHNDASKVEALVKAFADGKFCESVIPLPQFDDASGWQRRDFCANNWGTKWDIRPDFADCYDQDNAKYLYMEFESAWSPPVGIYAELHRQGFLVEAKYAEPGAGFIGHWANGVNNCQDISSAVDENGCYSLAL